MEDTRNVLRRKNFYLFVLNFNEGFCCCKGTAVQERLYIYCEDDSGNVPLTLFGWKIKMTPIYRSIVSKQLIVFFSKRKNPKRGGSCPWWSWHEILSSVKLDCYTCVNFDFAPECKTSIGKKRKFPELRKAKRKTKTKWFCNLEFNVCVCVCVCTNRY